jgi:hypothetical protein
VFRVRADLRHQPKRRLFEVLGSHGMQPNQQVTFLTDGGEDIRDLPRRLNPQAEHLLDWFHLTMRITVLTRLAKGLRAAPETPPDIAAARLQRVKWFLWHGNVFRARQTIDDLAFDLADAGVESGKLAQGGPRVRRLPRRQRLRDPQLRGTPTRRRNHLHLVRGIRGQPGDQQTHGQRSSRCDGAPAARTYSLQIRTRVLNNTLADDYRRWYPGFTHTDRQDQAA